jgi:uncharacterized protein YqgC (DUF456 family)
VTATDLVCGLLVVVGLFGIVVPVLPGTILVLAGILLWAAGTGSAAAWGTAAVATACLVAGAVVKYAVPGRRLKAVVPTWTLVVGGIGAVVGFFVIPVVGALAGFPIGVFLAECVRVGAAEAWSSTKAAMGAVGLGIMIELGAAVLAVLVWVAGAVAA